MIELIDTQHKSDSNKLECLGRSSLHYVTRTTDNLNENKLKRKTKKQNKIALKFTLFLNLHSSSCRQHN